MLVADASSSSDSSKLPQWAIIVIAVMAGFVILTGLVIMLVLLFTWLNHSRYVHMKKSLYPNIQYYYNFHSSMLGL